MDTITHLEKIYVSDTYETISSHFSSTRHSHWNGVKTYIDEIKKLYNLTQINFLDYGCGNGKYLSLCEEFNKCVGFDNCSGLLKIVKERFQSVPSIQTIQGDVCVYNQELSNQFDSIICIAVIHHLSNESRRIDAVKNIIQYLKQDGTALISVWATTLDTSKYTKLDTPNDWLVGWNKEYNRYYHLFEKEELENIIKQADKYNQIVIIDVFFELSNWFIKIKKN
jgi:SAM-dependent methyltransferase